MSTILIGKFNGLIPRIGPSALQDEFAQVARNVKVSSGELRAWKKPKASYTTHLAGAVSIFKMEGAGGNSVWCEWCTDTDVCYGPIADKDEFRIYYSEGGIPKKTNWELATRGDVGVYPRNWLYLGVPVPKEKLTLKANRTPNDPDKWKEDHPNEPYEEFSADNTDTRGYCYTYVSSFGSIKEESAPSEVVTVDCDTTGGSVEISDFTNPPVEHYNITQVRIYRTVTGLSTAALLLVDQIDLTDEHAFPEKGSSYNGVPFSDHKYIDKRTNIQLGKILDTLYYQEPPEGLKGLVSMPNGFLAGFIDNQVWFSEPYLPHAWPFAYMLTTDSPIVGLGVYGNTLVVMTVRQPYIVSGTHPSAMSQEKLPMVQPCISKSSIAYDQYGVLYASPYGLVSISGGQMDVFTREILTQDEWREYNPSTIVAAMYNNLYMASYRKDKDFSMLVFARNDSPALVNYDFAPTAMHVERGTGRLFCLNEDDRRIYQLDADEINYETYEWRSKRFTNPYMTSFGAMKLDAEFNDRDAIKEWEAIRNEILQSNKFIWEAHQGGSLLGELHAVGFNHFTINGSELQDIPNKAEMRNVSVTLIADGKEIYTKQFTSVEAVRVPAIPAYSWEIRFTGNLRVTTFAMSSLMSELASPR